MPRAHERSFCEIIVAVCSSAFKNASMISSHRRGCNCSICPTCLLSSTRTTPPKKDTSTARQLPRYSSIYPEHQLVFFNEATLTARDIYLYIVFFRCSSSRKSVNERHPGIFLYSPVPSRASNHTTPPGKTTSYSRISPLTCFPSFSRFYVLWSPFSLPSITLPF